MGKVIQLQSKINHPYMDVLQKQLQVQKKLLEHLQIRMTLKRSFKDDYERNEHEIMLIKTTGEISAIDRLVKEKEQYFIKFMQQFTIDLEECDRHFDLVLTKAKESTNEEVKKLLPIIDWNRVNSNAEDKVKIFKKLKALVY